MSWTERAAGPTWVPRFGLTWLSGMILVAAGVANAVQMKAEERPSAPEQGEPLQRLGYLDPAPAGDALTIDLIDPYDAAEVQVRVDGCTDEPVQLTGRGTRAPMKVWNVDQDEICVVQARRKDGLFWTRWTQPVRVRGGVDLAIALPAERAGGLGMRIRGEHEGAYVDSVIPYTPAWQAGIEPGDVVVSVDGWTLQGMSTDEMIERITGAEGSAAEVGLVDVRSGRLLYRTVERRFMQ